MPLFVLKFNLTTKQKSWNSLSNYPTSAWLSVDWDKIRVVIAVGLIVFPMSWQDLFYKVADVDFAFKSHMMINFAWQFEVTQGGTFNQVYD